MLAGIFYGAQYGSSTAAILLNIPGTATAAIKPASTATPWPATGAPGWRCS